MKTISSCSRSGLCFECAHFYWNNRDLKKDGFRGDVFGCRAYPDGQPYGYPKGDHVKVQNNQVGGYVFEQVEPALKFVIERESSVGETRFKEFGHY